MKQLGVQHSYTLEASVCGTLTSSDSTHVQTHFNIQDYQEMGRIFCETLFEFLSPTTIQVSDYSAPLFTNHYWFSVNWY